MYQVGFSLHDYIDMHGQQNMKCHSVVQSYSYAAQHFGTVLCARDSKARRALATKKLLVLATCFLSAQSGLHRDSMCMCSSA